MPTKGNLGQDPNSQESARSSQSYISNLVVIPVEEGINPVQLNTEPAPQPEDFLILTKPDGTSYKTTLDATRGVNSGASSLNVISSNDTVTQVSPSSFDPITRQIEVDLTVTPQVNADWDATTGISEILNKPTIPAAQVNSDWDATTGISEILNKPTIPAAQVNSDWDATTGISEILNKPTIPAAQVNSDWDATTGISEILNKPGASSTTTPGLIQLATQTEVNDGTDASKSVTPSTLAAPLALKAPLDSPAFTDIPTAPTAPFGTNTDQLATMKALINNGSGIIASGSNANGKWIKYANGRIVQTGTVVMVDSSGGGLPVTLPISFTTSFDYVNGSTDANNLGYNANNIFPSRTLSTFNFANWNGVTVNLNWTAEGY